MSQVSKADEKEIENVYEKIRKLKETNTYDIFIEKSRRLYGIETGQIEGLYTLKQEIIMQLVEMGIHSQIIEQQFKKNAFSIEIEIQEKAIEIAEIINDNIRAFLYIEKIIQEKRNISIDVIKEIHEIFLYSARYLKHPKEGMRLLRRGKFKLKPNTVFDKKLSKFWLFIAPSKVEISIENLLIELDSMLKREKNIFKVAAWFHCIFIAIHPFDDGNGRVARALTSIVLGESGFLPLTINSEMAEEYHNAINELLLNGNDIPMVKLIIKQQEYVMDIWKN